MRLIAYYKEILASATLVYDIIKTELLEMKDKFGTDNPDIVNTGRPEEDGTVVLKEASEETSDMIVMMGSDGVHYYYNSAENTFTSDIEDGTRYAEREIMEDDFREVVKNNPEAYMRKIPNMPHLNK